MSRFRRRLMSAIRKAEAAPVLRPLPVGYTPYEWIKCVAWNDGSYIDTGIADQATGIVVKMKVKNTVASPSGNQFIGTSAGWIHTLDIYGAAIRWVTEYDKFYRCDVTLPVGQVLEMEAGDDYLTVNGVSGYVQADGGNTVGGNLLLLRGRAYNTEIPIYYCQIYKDGILVRDFVPCSNPLGESGMFDFVSNTFFGNAGTGALIVGQDNPYYYENDGKIWAYYNVTDTSSPTVIGYNGSINRYYEMEIDGVSVTPTASYQFSTTGEHLVKLGLQKGAFTYTFNGVSALTRLYLPDTLTTIPNDFCNAARGLAFARIPTTTRVVGARCFYSCTALSIKDLSLPTLSQISTGAFYQVKIEEISSLGTLAGIPGNYIFAQNNALNKLTIPSTLSEIGNYAFDYCTSLQVITSKATTPPTLYTNVFRAVNPTAIYVPAESVETYKAASGWSTYANVIQAIPE